ncbi:MAG TPA: hypothetical protein H9828_08420 [Candidatus Alistipes intestinigallinarum]|uniref:IPT/TIG domain-containing protein n=1 Tax=Candidatus Alistipes intestinigallinarum TaxID=2838440 RepID=A0A9D1Z114_9BACT|nr:hypothetical protein [Candidatus Alistipes intestinigallinarum]
MKKLWLLLLAAGAMTFAPACSDDDDNGPSCPVKCTVPATAEIGSELTITGQGFDAAAEIALRDDSGVESKLENPQITATSYTGTVPLTLTPGSYTVVLYQEGIWELGSVQLTMAADKDCPVLSITVPETIRLNEELEIAGAGFTSDMQILLENTADQSRKELTVTLSGIGVTCTIPEGVSAGLYNVILKQGAYEWKIAESVPAGIYKRLKSVTVNVSIECETVTVEELAQYLYESSQDTGVTMDEATAQMYAEYYISNGAFDPMTNTAAYTFTYDAQGNPASSTKKGLYDEEVSDWLAFTVDGNQLSATNKDFEEGTDGIRSFVWTLDNGRIEASTISYEKRDVNYRWVYDAQGLWSGVNYASDNSAYLTLTYNAGKFLGNGSNTMFTYTDAPQQNAIFGVDMAKLFLGMQTINIIEADHLAAICLNLAGTSSTALPATVVEMDGSTPTITYTFDNDGYVTGVNWEVVNGKDPNFQHFDASNKTSYTLVYE